MACNCILTVATIASIQKSTALDGNPSLNQIGSVDRNPWWYSEWNHETKFTVCSL